jgi:hypothetical protein
MMSLFKCCLDIIPTWWFNFHLDASPLQPGSSAQAYFPQVVITLLISRLDFHP